MLHINTVHVQRETLWVSSWLGNSTRWFVVHEHVNIHILRSLLWDCVHTAVCEKCLVHRGECVTTGECANSNNDLEKENCICYLYGLGVHAVYACKYGTNWCLKYGTITYYTEQLVTLYKMQKRIDSGAPSVQGPGL